MLTKKQTKEIREELQSCASPLFYFDNDQDGLISFILLRRFIEKGRGIPVKNSPMDETYFRRVKEFEPDKIFILDVPEVSEEMFSKLKEYGAPVVWVDHHDIDFSKVPEWVKYYNPVKDGKENTPVCVLSQEVVGKKDFWLGVIGAISDHYVPSFYEDFLKDYPDLGIKSEKPFEIFYNSEIGRISRMLGAGLKDKTSSVFKMLRFLYEVKTPYDLVEEKKENKELHKRFDKIDERFSSLMEKAKKEVSEGKVLFFKYSGETSMSADLSNKLSYLYPEKVVIVAYVLGTRVNVSLRGEKIRGLALEVLKKFESARGGGHENAVGCQLDLNDLEEFVEEIGKRLK